MAYPKEFYYTDTTSATSYSDSPTGVLDVGQLIRNKPCWIAQSAPQEPKPKKLILADWSARAWSEEKVNEVKEQFSKLLDEGFELYVWHQGNIIKLPRENLSCLDDCEFRSAINLDYTEKIIKQAVDTHNLTHDHIQVLDDYLVRQTLSNSMLEADGRVLFLNDLICTTHERFKKFNERHYKKIIKLLMKSVPEIQAIIHDVFSMYGNKNIKILRTLIPSIPIIPKYKKILLSGSQLAELVCSGEINSDGAKLNNFEDVLELDLNCDHGVNELMITEILNKISREKTTGHLKKLKLYNCRDLSDLGPDIIFCGLSNLEVLDLSHNDIKAHTVNKLLAATNKLLKLNLDGYNESGKLTIPTGSLSYLKELNLADSNISAENIETLLAAATNLEHLYLRSNSECTKDFTLLDNSLSHLISISVGNSTIPFAKLEQYLKAAPHLTTITLQNSILKDGICNITANSLPEMRSLNLSGTKINASDLKKLFLAAPNLKFLNLGSTNNLEAMALELGIFHWPLEELYLYQCKIGFQTLECFLQNTEHLKELNLRHSSFADELLSHPELMTHMTERELPNLESLNLCGCLIPTHVIKTFLQHSPKLKNLDLSNCKISLSILEFFLQEKHQLTKLDLSYSSGVDDEVFLEHVSSKSLPNLESLNLMGSSLSPSFIKTLLQASPDLKRIDISSIKADLNSIFLINDKLLQLESINLNDNDEVTYSLLNQIAKVAPNLKDLKLSSCSRLSESHCSLKPESLPYLETLDLTSTLISPDDLKILLRAAPNLKKIELPNEIKNHGIDHELQTLLDKIDDITFYQTELSNKKISTMGAQSSSTSTPLEPPHNASDMRAHKPTSGDSNFEFHGENKTKNQAMIIEKLSQYLILSHKNLKAIPKLQDGICNALSHYFLDKPEEFNLLIDRVTVWDGRPETLSSDSELKYFFDTLYSYVIDYQLKSGGNYLQYLGENIPSFLESCKPGTSYILNNPWHAITVRRLAGVDLWEVYDPNFPDGPRKVHNAELMVTIHRCIGRLLSLESKHAILAPRLENPAAAESGGLLGLYNSAVTTLYTGVSETLGMFVKADPSQVRITHKLEDPATFIKNGGLLVLCNNSNVAEIMTELTPIGDYSEDALEGILLRDVKGTPAWVRALSLPIIFNYTIALLGQFIAKNPTNYIDKLQQSMECLTPEHKHESITRIIQMFAPRAGKDDAVLRDTLVDLIRTEHISTLPYEHQLATWESHKPAVESLLSYCHHCLSPIDIKKQLIQLSSTEDVDAMAYALQKTAKIKHRPIFYVNYPDDLRCSAPFVERQANGRGVLRNGPGGPLYEFLEANKGGESPILIVNYEHFKAEDIVSFNSLLDPKARADGSRLPKDTLVIGLINVNKTTCYQGADFYSRFDLVETCPISKELLASTLPSLPVSQKEEPPPVIGSVINLYNAEDWEERLIGRWTLKDNALVFEEGALAKAIADAKGGLIEIKNAPWDTLPFQQFCQQALLTGSVDNGRIPIPADIKLLRSKGYDWDDLKPTLTVMADLLVDANVLNPGRIGEFFNHYVCENSNLTCQPGLIKLATDNSLDVNLTHALSDDAWAMILATCKEHRVKLVVHCSPGVEIPQFLGNYPTIEPVILEKTTTGNRDVVVSTDLDTTVAQCNSQDDWTVIDISECKPSDLLRRIDGSLVKGDLPRFAFKEQPSALIQALARGDKIILKGNFSTELVDELAPLLLSRQAHPDLPGSLVLITQDGRPFNYIPQQKHTVEACEKITLLGELTPVISHALEPFMSESLSQLKARCDFLKAHPESIYSDEAWAGIHHLSGGIPDLGELDVNTSAKETKDFTDKRLSDVRVLLDRDHYVFLSGLSGVGKSTFVIEELCEDDDTLYSGDKNIEAWALDTTTPGRKLLFLDEANLSSREWSEFEGLFNKPPTILIHGVLHTLSPSHQVIFAGNPLSYGDERKLAPLFQRHGNAVVFSPLTPAVLYEKSLKPIFKGTEIAKFAPEICKHILKVYGFLCKCSTSEVLISPRELQMIALMVLAAHKNNKATNPLDLAEHYAHQLGANLLASPRFQIYQDAFAKEFKPKIPLVRPESPKIKNFLLTPSRIGIKQQLDDFLTLRELRRFNSHKGKGNDIQQYGGIGGLVIEGPPGVGKSELVIAALRARGYTEMHNFSGKPKLKKTHYHMPNKISLMQEKHTKENNIFYRMPASMSFNEKSSLLLKAFHEGAVVIIDEINSMPMMERLLNDLLMGKTPENKRPKNPGFMLIGTQNPISMAGRRAPSTALARRLAKVELPEYRSEEIQTILEAKHIPTNEAHALAIAFKKQVAYAHDNHLTPIPTFRHLLKLAKQINKGHRLEANMENNTIPLVMAPIDEFEIEEPKHERQTPFVKFSIFNTSQSSVQTDTSQNNKKEEPGPERPS